MSDSCRESACGKGKGSNIIVENGVLRFKD